MEASHRSIHPNIPGVPWWAAILIATTATAVGYAIDAGLGHKELTNIFAGCYIAGCLAAVLAVRQSGVFTAVIQPPLILFCAVPGAYWLFHGGNIDKIKDLLINCGYPLIERFPLMLGTAGGVLLVGLIRWYFGMTHRTGVAAKATDGAASTPRTSLFDSIAAKLSSLLASDSDDDADGAATTDPQPATGLGQRPRSNRAARGSRSAKRPTQTRSRRARPASEDKHEPTAERSRRQQSRSGAASVRDADAADRRSRRRPRPQSDPDLRAQPPREMRRDPHPRRNPHERPEPRSSRFDPYEMYEPPERSDRFNRYERYGPAYDPYSPYERNEPPYEPPHRRAAPPGPNGGNPTHHPISRVRYRTSAPRDEARGEPRPDRRSRSRATQRRPPAESWEYDI